MCWFVFAGFYFIMNSHITIPSAILIYLDIQKFGESNTLQSMKWNFENVNYWRVSNYVALYELREFKDCEKLQNKHQKETS